MNAPSRRRFRFQQLIRECATPAVSAGLVYLLLGCASARVGPGGHRLDSVQRIGDWNVRTFCRRTGGGSFALEKNGVLWCRKVSAAGGFYIGGEREEFDQMGGRMWVPVRADLTGDQIPCVVITEFSGQLPLTFRDYIFELGDSPRLIGCIDSGRSPLVYSFEEGGDINIVLKNQLAEKEGLDPRWLAGLEEVTFSYINGYYCPLRSDVPPAITTEAVSQLAGRIRSQFRPSPGQHQYPPAMLEDAVDLLAYAGCKDLALRLIEDAWPAQAQGKESYRQQVLAFFTAAPDGLSASGPDTLNSQVPERLSRRFGTEPMRR